MAHMHAALARKRAQKRKTKESRSANMSRVNNLGLNHKRALQVEPLWVFSTRNVKRSNGYCDTSITHIVSDAVIEENRLKIKQMEKDMKTCPNCSLELNIVTGKVLTNHALNILKELLCEKCHHVINTIFYGNIIEINGRKRSESMIKMTDFITSHGGGFSEMQDFTIHSGVGSVSSATFVKYQKEIGSVIREQTDQSMKNARDEHKRLHGEHIKIGGDAAWQKRGYHSRNGAYGAISQQTKKVVSFTTYTKGENYEGTSSGMDPRGLNDNLLVLDEDDFIVDSVSTDADSRTPAIIKSYNDASGQNIIQGLDGGHVKKNVKKNIMSFFTKENLKKLPTDENKQGIYTKWMTTLLVHHMVDDIHSYALRHAETPSQAKEYIENIVNHMLPADKNHTNCKTKKLKWCRNVNDRKYVSSRFGRQYPIPQQRKLFLKSFLKVIFKSYTEVSLTKLLVDGSTVLNEALHHVITKPAPKDKTFMTSERYETAAKLGVLQWNEGENHIIDRHENLGMTVANTSKTVINQRTKKRTRERENAAKVENKVKRRVKRLKRIHKNVPDAETYCSGKFLNE